jgi:hypothetical protein
MTWFRLAKHLESRGEPPRPAACRFDGQPAAVVSFPISNPLHLQMIAIIDYGMGNLRSVQKGFEKVGHQAFITNNPEAIRDASKVILPGVGAFPDAMHELRRRELIEPIRAAIDSGRPLLGICLGLQLLF